MQEALDCHQFKGRMRDICRGHDDAGNPINLSKEKREAYLRLWEQRQKGLPPAAPAPCMAGTMLKRSLSLFGLVPTEGCKCSEHAAEMDRRGCDWCAENVETIVGWLKEEAERRELVFSEYLARRVVLVAIWRARRSQRKAEKASIA